MCQVSRPTKKIKVKEATLLAEFCILTDVLGMAVSPDLIFVIVSRTAEEG
jgi:hypothetical protein